MTSSAESSAVFPGNVEADLLEGTLRPQVQAFSPYVAGLSIAEIMERHGLAQVIKLASNENPLGASPVVMRRVCDSAGSAFRYPQAGTPRLRKAIAAKLGVQPEMIVPGNGSDEIIDLLIRVRARPGDEHFLAFSPCFSIYTLQSALQGVEARQVPLRADFSFPFAALADRATEKSALAFVTNPDNPSGHAVLATEICRFVESLPQTCIVVVDEAYVDFALPVDEYSMLPHLAKYPNLVILRTFSKCYGLAGLRLGYGVMHPWLAAALMKVRLPFSVNLLAEEAGLAALEDEIFYTETVRVVVEGRTQLAEGLTRLGCAVQPSLANFLLFRLPAGCTQTARQVFEALLARGVIIRPLNSYNLPDALRVSVGTAEENSMFLAALEAVLGN
ncbi:histidinol-phosphate transaminase [Megalodesulfovibrio paquesii]